VVTVWGTNDSLRKSVIVSFHGHSQGRLNGQMGESSSTAPSGANCLIIRHYQLPISSHSQRDHIFHRRLSDRSLLYSWTTCLTDCGYRIRATSTNICTLLHVPVVLRFLAITRIGNLIREALSAFPQMLCMSKLRVPRRFRLVQQLRVHMNVFDGKGAALINKTLLQLPQ
jgi:hypothetical protein